MKKRSDGRTCGVKFLLLAVACLLLAGCQQSVQTVTVDLATPSPRPELVPIGDAPVGESYSITIVPPGVGDKGGDAAALPDVSAEIDVLPTREPTQTPRLTPSPVPTVPPTPTPSPTPTPTPEPTATPKATATPKPTAAPTAKPKATATSKPTASPTPKPTDTPKPTATPTPEPTAPPQQTSSQELPAVSSGAYSAEDVLLAARVAYFESGKTEEGYRAVLCVVVNRVESGRWPDSVYDVVYQKNQFTVISRSDFLTKTIPDSVISYADDVLNRGNRLLESSVMSFRSEHTDKTWGDRTFVGTYGGNDFYS